MRKLAFSLLFSVSAFGIEIYLSPKYMTWEEFVPSKGRLLKESGFILGVGLIHEKNLFAGGVEIYGGVLNYDGQTQAGTPVETDTRYLGGNAHIGIWKEWGEKVKLKGNLSYRVESWIRDIRSTSQAEGYSEVWFFDALDVGLKISKGMYYAFSTYRFMFRDARMKASIEGVPVLRPKKGPAYEIGAGIKLSSFSVELTYQYTKFRLSDPKPFRNGYVLQPVSVRKLYILRLSRGF